MGKRKRQAKTHAAVPLSRSHPPWSSAQEPRASCSHSQPAPDAIFPALNPWAGLESNLRYGHTDPVPTELKGPDIQEALNPVPEGDLANEGPPAQHKYVNNTIPPSVRMKQFLEGWAACAQTTWLEREIGPPVDISCGECGCSLDLKSKENGLVYRCYDCYEPPLHCVDCAIKTHRHNPFHRIEEWDSSLGFWIRRSMGEVKTREGKPFVLDIGHPGGGLCPLHAVRDPRSLTLGHEHGIHEYRVRFCRCDDVATGEEVPEPVQLIRFGLWPGSWVRPQSAYTISGLREFHLLSLQSQISTHDIIAYLRRQTDNVITEDVPDRYREYLTAMREFAFIRATKRAGLDPSKPLKAGALAVLCAGCPQPHVNMQPGVKREPGEEYLDALFYTIDGNFQQTQKMKPMDVNDRPLTLGGAFYANEDDFETFQKDRPRDKKDETTCNQFGAMGYSRYQGRVTGMVGLSCARHGLALPLSSVDLDQGEAFAFADFVQCSGLKPYHSLPLLVCAYDINCQYQKRFPQRIQKMKADFPKLQSIRGPVFPRILAAIGKFHLFAHIPSCQFKFSFNYLPGVGMTDGEALERLWSILNGLASRTKEMTSGHRHDVTNDVNNDVNVRKVHKMPPDLAKRHSHAVDQSKAMEDTLRVLERHFGEEDLAAMKAEEQQWLADVVDQNKHKELNNPYELRVDRGGDAAAKKKVVTNGGTGLTTAELLAERPKTHGHDGSEEGKQVEMDIIYEGVELQSVREDLLDVIEEDDGSPEMQEMIEKAYDNLASRVGRWSEAFNMVLRPLLEAAAVDVQQGSTNSGNPPEVSPEFPMKALPQPEPSVTTKLARAELGLPPLRNARGKSELWLAVNNTQILLPSSLDSRLLRHGGVATLATWEGKVRVGQANDALNDLRTHIITSETLKLQKMDAIGKKATLRMGKKIRRQHDQVVAAADEYRRAWVALNDLGKADALKFPPLRKTDVRKFNTSNAHQQLGDSNKRPSWIWEDLSFVDHHKDGRYKDFLDDVKRVHWFRSRALCARWREEVRLLKVEMTRTVLYFGHFRAKWTKQARGHEETGDSARVAYCRKQAHRHVRLLLNAQKHYATLSAGIPEWMWRDALSDEHLRRDVD